MVIVLEILAKMAVYVTTVSIHLHANAGQDMRERIARRVRFLAQILDDLLSILKNIID